MSHAYALNQIHTDAAMDTPMSEGGLHAPQAPIPAKSGRPRSEESRKAILDATRRLMLHTPLRDLSIEAIARKAGVGKTTIYRWWPNKVAVVIEAFSDQLDLHTPNLTDLSMTMTDALMGQVDKMIRHLRGRNGRIIADIMAEAQADEGVMALLQAFYMDTRKQTLQHIVYQGQRSGEFAAVIAPDIAADMIMGPVFFRLLTTRDGLDDRFIEDYPVTVLNMIRGA
ncbi:TetR/AcrR family transcriptional regulator [Micavibrio aeruginosavorus]|uniref:Transcriptional regulator, TetR family n=1 Tax=Micavibrio aeruginosavorus EPB TaxID=349215 RepID=M4VFQ1_9BACT|nr:TetR/AcrR family transcriptional regulator [Micavibrio aeruginosavorus]AGH97320.1 transcriptional regulator, TetR family [Micavibrio aeruginosavorus EPB]